MKYAIRAAVAGAIAISVVALLDRYGGAFDLTRGATHSLSTESARVARELPAPVEVIAFYRPEDPRTSRIVRLLDQYADATPKFRYRVVDPDRFPGEARRYGVEVYGTTVLESEGRRRTIPNRSENALTTALLLLFDEAPRTVLFDESYGGRRITDDGADGLLQAADALRASGFAVEPFLLKAADTIPPGTDVLVLAGPRLPLDAPVVDSLESFVRRGGRVLLLLDPETAGETAAFPRRFGIDAGAAVVVDRSAALYGGDMQTPVIARYDLHDATRGIRGASVFARARPLSLYDRGRGADEVRSLLTTGDEAWGETDVALLGSTGKAVFEPAHDQEGPLAIAMSASVPGAEGTRGRLVVFGDSDWASNRFFDQGAHAGLFVNVVKYLGWEGAALGIPIDDAVSEPLLLSRPQGRFFLWFGVAVLPGLWALCGFAFVYRWRRTG